MHPNLSVTNWHTHQAHSLSTALLVDTMTEQEDTIKQVR